VERVIANNSRASAWTAKRSRSSQIKKQVRDRGLTGQSAARFRNNTQVDETGLPKIVGIMVFDQMAAAALIGPAEVFSRTKIRIGHGSDRHCYRVVTVGVSLRPCVTESGITVVPQFDLQHTPPLDSLIIPGGIGIHQAKVNRKIINWLRRRAPSTRRIAALEAGVCALAATGLLDQRQVVTHWRFAKDVAVRFPKLRLNYTNLFVKDGPFYTCAGAASAIDLSLALVEEDYGRQVALKLARELLVPLKRSGGHEQYSEMLKFQVQSSDRFADLAAWILSHLSDNLSIDALAEMVCMSRRNFTRLFRKTFGKSPSEFVAEARINEARQRVLIPRNNLESVASSLGFRSADAFSEAFERHVGVRPLTYRARVRSSTARNNFEN
jgi:transcriptional regulator GlxA family with amidase domain